MISRILPFPRGRMKMTTYSDDDVSDYASDRVFDGVRPLSPDRAAKLRTNYFTRVVEETGVLDQGRSQKEKSR